MTSFPRLSGLKAAASRAVQSAPSLTTAAELCRVGLQATLLILLARVLGAESFGRIFGTMALLLFLQPFAWCGCWLVQVQVIARGVLSVREAASRSVATVVLGGSVALAVAVVLLKPLLAPTVEMPVFIILSLTELVFFGVTESLVYTCLATKSYGRVLLLRVMSGATRIAALALLVMAFVSVDEMLWVVAYAVSTGLVPGVFWLLLRRRYGLHASLRPFSKALLRDGVHFAVAGTAANAQDNLDKPIVLRLAGSVDAAVYAAGYRAITVALVPLRALMQTTYSRFFLIGKSGLSPSARYARKLLPAAAAYSVGVGVLMYFAAPAASLLFGPGFEEVGDVIRWLCVIPFVRALTYLIGDSLTGAGLQRERSRFIVFTSVINVLLNLVLVGPMGWRGAAVATVIADSALAFSLSLYCYVKVRREKGWHSVCP
jgi:O-antigen/teichoic acid export membrane protein